ncbi:hypothetical protein, partial [Myxococcus vastator]|uniref:hypothetical protein n=1 Tax=Myxococcus vastator TaxID=2709664 RepID=UPI0013D7DE91
THTNSSDASVHELQSLISDNEFDSVEKLLLTVARPKPEDFPGASTIWSSGRNAEARLCAIAMAHLGPKDPETGETLRVEQLRTLLDDKKIGGLYQTIPNTENSVVMRLILSDRKKINRLHSASVDVLQSHGLENKTIFALEQKNYQDFKQRRGKKLDEWFQKFFTERSAPTESDRPSITELVRRVDVKATKQ